MNKLTCFIFYIFFTTCALANTPMFLNEQEKQWLKEHPIITVGIDNNFAPFEFIDENGEFKGISADYLVELEKILHVKFNIIKTKDWNEVIKMTQSNQIDVLSCIVPTPQREEYLNFTRSYLSFPMVIVTNKMTGFINGIKDLDGKTVAVIDGYTPHQILESNYKNIHLVKTKNITQALELVASGKTFAHVGNLSRVTYFLKEKGFQNLSISGICVYAQILGLSDEEVKISAKEFQKNFIHKEDLPRVLEELESYFANIDMACSVQFRIHAKDGKLKKVESRGEIFQFDAYNNPMVLFGFIKELKD